MRGAARPLVAIAAACFTTASFSGCDLQEWIYCSIDYSVCHAAEPDTQAPSAPTALRGCFTKGLCGWRRTRSCSWH